MRQRCLAQYLGCRVARRRVYPFGALYTLLVRQISSLRPYICMILAQPLQLLMSTITDHGGDVLRLAGDALIVAFTGRLKGLVGGTA